MDQERKRRRTRTPERSGAKPNSKRLALDPSDLPSVILPPVVGPAAKRPTFSIDSALLPTPGVITEPILSLPEAEPGGPDRGAGILGTPPQTVPSPAIPPHGSIHPLPIALPLDPPPGRVIQFKREVIPCKRNASQKDSSPAKKQKTGPLTPEGIEKQNEEMKKPLFDLRQSHIIPPVTNGSLRIGTWNVTSCRTHEAKKQIANYMEKHSIAILAIQEPKTQKQEAVEIVPAGEVEYIFINPQKDYAAGFFVEKWVYENSTHSFYRTGRICSLILTFKRQTTQFISVYSPTDLSGNHRATHDIYTTLSFLLGQHPHNTYIMGDFNLTLLAEHRTARRIGPWGLRSEGRKRNAPQNADIFTSWISKTETKLKTLNTIISRPRGEATTYRPPLPDGKTHMKDLILIPQKETLKQSHQIHTLFLDLPMYTQHALLFTEVHRERKTRRGHRCNKCNQGPIREVRMPIPPKRPLVEVQQNYVTKMREMSETFLACAPTDVNAYVEEFVMHIREGAEAFKNDKIASPEKTLPPEYLAISEAKNRILKSVKHRAMTPAEKSEMGRLKKEQKRIMEEDQKTKFNTVIKKAKGNNVLASITRHAITRQQIDPPRKQLPLFLQHNPSAAVMPQRRAISTYIHTLFRPRESKMEPHRQMEESTRTEAEQLLQEILGQDIPPKPNITTRKAASHDRIPPPLLNGSENLLKQLRKMMFDSLTVPELFKVSRLSFLNKTPPESILENYRTISIRPAMWNAISRTLLPVFNLLTRKTVSATQFCKPSHGCKDNLYLLTQLIRICRKTKTPLIITFLDLVKAFDSLSHAFLKKIILARCPPPLAAFLLSFYGGIFFDYEKVRMPLLSGVMQGDPLSMILFVWALDDVVQRTEEEMGEPGITLRTPKSNPHMITDLANSEDTHGHTETLSFSNIGYADDLAIPSTDYAQHSRYLACLEANIQQATGMMFSLGAKGKSKTISFSWNKEKVPEIAMSANKIPQVERHTHLGVVISKTGAYHDHIEKRKEMADRKRHMLIKNSKRNAGKEGPRQAVQEILSSFLPTLLYGIDILSPSQTDLTGLDPQLNGLLRKIFDIPYDPEKKAWNKTTEEARQMANIPSIPTMLRISRQTFLYHLIRAPISYPGIALLHACISPEEKKVEPPFWVKDATQGLDGVTLNDFSQRPIFENIIDQEFRTGKVLLKKSLRVELYTLERKSDLCNIPVNTTYLAATDGGANLEKKMAYSAWTDGTSIQHEETHPTNTVAEETAVLRSLQKRLQAMQKTGQTPEPTTTSLITISDSLQTLKLIKSLITRQSNQHILDEIDIAVEGLSRYTERIIFVHVFSHRRHTMSLNQQVDRHISRLMEAGENEDIKCTDSCTEESLCNKCEWNKNVDTIVKDLHNRQRILPWQ